MTFARFLMVMILLLCIFPLLGSASVFVSLAQTVEGRVVSIESEATTAMVVAEERIVVCHQAVDNANRVGANTTGLLIVLNEAGNLLSKAEWAYKKADFSASVGFAALSQERLSGFVEKVATLEAAAIQQGDWDFKINVVGSILGTVGVLCSGYVSWFFLERKYGKTGSAA